MSHLFCIHLQDVCWLFWFFLLYTRFNNIDSILKSSLLIPSNRSALIQLVNMDGVSGPANHITAFNLICGSENVDQMLSSFDNFSIWWNLVFDNFSIWWDPIGTVFYQFLNDGVVSLQGSFCGASCKWLFYTFVYYFMTFLVWDRKRSKDLYSECGWCGEAWQIEMIWASGA